MVYAPVANSNPYRSRMDILAEPFRNPTGPLHPNYLLALGALKLGRQGKAYQKSYEGALNNITYDTNP